MNKITWIIVIVLLVIYLFPKPYTSSAGFVTPEMNAEFEITRQQCAGFSVLTNAAQMAADAPGRSLCFGWLY